MDRELLKRIIVRNQQFVKDIPLVRRHVSFEPQFVAANEVDREIPESLAKFPLTRLPAPFVERLGLLYVTNL